MVLSSKRALKQNTVHQACHFIKLSKTCFLGTFFTETLWRLHGFSRNPVYRSQFLMDYLSKTVSYASHPKKYDIQPAHQTTEWLITRNIRRNLLYLLHLLSMTVKQLTQPLTHVLIGLFSLIINHFMELHFLIFELVFYHSITSFPFAVDASVSSSNDLMYFHYQSLFYIIITIISIFTSFLSLCTILSEHLLTDHFRDLWS